MGVANFLRWWADRFDPPQTPVFEPDVEMEEPPPGSMVVLDEINHAQVVGQPGTHFTRKAQNYTDASGKKCKRTLKNNVHVSGCGHNVSKPEDIAFTSYISKKPVCKTCEREYKRMRNQTRHEECICRHLVAPHELKYMEGKGFVCEECEKKENALKPLKAVKWVAWLFLKPLIIEEPPPQNEVPYETNELPPPYPPVPYNPPAWPGNYPPYQAPHDMGRGRPGRPNNHPRA